MKKPILKLVRKKAKEANKGGHKAIIVFSKLKALEIYNRAEGKINVDDFNELIDANAPFYIIQLKQAYWGGCKNMLEALFNSQECLLRQRLLQLDSKEVLIDFYDE